MSMVLDEYYEEITQGYQHSAYNRLLVLLYQKHSAHNYQTAFSIK